jgi:CBS domain-containing protein
MTAEPVDPSALRSDATAPVRVADAMSTDVLSVGPDHTLREAARMMSRRGVGSAVVMDPESQAPGILTERDILDALAADQDPDRERVSGHLTPDVTAASPQWSLRDAADAMMAGGFRHLVVCDAADVVGVLSVRDIVRWHASHPVGS